MKRTFYFVRHGQTVANAEGFTQGPNDPLNDTGLMQAKILARRAKNLPFEAIISSDYPRALVTAQTIQATTDKPLIVSALFREMRRPSAFWGKVVSADPKILEGYRHINEHFTEESWHHSDEENFFDIKNRAIEALDYLAARKEECLLVVTHGNFLRALLGIMMRGRNAYGPQDYRDIESTFEISNTSISVTALTPHWSTVTNETWMVISWNDCAHLAEIP